MSGPDHTLDCPIFQIFLEGQKQGLKNGSVRSITVDQFATGRDHGLDCFFLDRTTHWTTFFWTGLVQSIKVDQFATGSDHGLDRFFLDQTTHWTAPYSKFPGGGQKQGLKNGPVWSITVDQFATGPNHGLDRFFFGPDHTLDHFFWTRPHNGPLFSGPHHTLDCPIFQISWGGQKQGLKNGPVRSITVDQFATGPDHGLDHFFLDHTTHWTAQ